MDSYTKENAGEHEKKTCDKERISSGIYSKVYKIPSTKIGRSYMKELNPKNAKQIAAVTMKGTRKNKWHVKTERRG
jgi:hypothetical protein